MRTSTHTLTDAYAALVKLLHDSGISDEAMEELAAETGPAGLGRLAAQLPKQLLMLLQAI